MGTLLPTKTLKDNLEQLEIYIYISICFLVLSAVYKVNNVFNATSKKVFGELVRKSDRLRQ